MTFEIKNPNYSRETLEAVAAAVISRHDSTDFDTTAFYQKAEGMLTQDKEVF